MFEFDQFGGTVVARGAAGKYFAILRVPPGLITYFYIDVVRPLDVIVNPMAPEATSNIASPAVG